MNVYLLSSKTNYGKEKQVNAACRADQYTVLQNASTKRVCSFGEMKSYPSPAPGIFSLADVPSIDCNFPGKNTLKLVLKLLLKTNSKKITSARHLPPIPFLAVCKQTVLLRQLSGPNQPCCRAFFIYPITYIHPEVWEDGGEYQLHQNHLVKQKRTSSRTCGEKI